MRMESRIQWVDYAKAFGIFLVVLGHAGFPESVRSVIYVFHIPLFFFLSGMFFKPEKYANYNVFLKKRLRQLVVPYLFFNIATYLFWVIIGRHFGKDALLVFNPLHPLLGILYGTPTNHFLEHNAPMWFLACLFMTESLYFLIFKNINNQLKIIGLIVFAMIGFIDYRFNYFFRLPWGLNVSLVVIVFYGLGSILSDKLQDDDSKSKFLLSAITFICSILVLLVAYFNGKIEVSMHEYGNYLLFWLGAFAGIGFVISVMKLLQIYHLNLFFIEFIGKNTLIILGFHLTAGTFIKAIIVYVFNQEISVFDYQLVELLYSVLSIIVLVPVIFILNKYFPVLIGKSHLKNENLSR